MRKAGREVPEVTLRHVVNEHGAVWVQNSDAGVAVEHDGPLICRVPMQFAEAASGKTHVDAGEFCGWRQFALRHLVRPATLFQAFPRDVKGIPDGADVPMIGRRWRVRVWILSQQWLVFLPWIARGMIPFCLASVLSLLSICRHSREGRCCDCSRTNLPQIPSRWRLYEFTLLLFINHCSSLLVLIRRLTELLVILRCVNAGCFMGVSFRYFISSGLCVARNPASIV